MRVLFTVLLSIFAPSIATAAAPDERSPEAKGRAIAEEAARRDDGFGDSATELSMRLVSADGRIRERRLTWQILENPDPSDGDKSLTIFHEPRDIAGTAFLTFTHIGRDDDQWLYLPALKRVKRIAAVNKTSAFMGSELAYEDLLSDEVEKFDYRWIRNETCGDLTCFVLERRPRYPHSGYSRQVVWLDQTEYRPMKIEYHDLRDRHLKTLTIEGYQQYLARYWRGHTYRMQNHRTAKETLLFFGPYDFQTGLTEQAFDPSGLRRLR
jgi:outer membrane lipoprotein-sorting protein